jgi:peroxiredoxin
LSDLVGQDAPDFTLRDQDGKKVTLSDLRGQTVVLVFYPLDWSPVCTDQLSLYQDSMSHFKKQGATLYGVSVDSAFSHKAFRDHLGIEFPLLADFEPKGEVARKYGMYMEKHGTNERGFVVIDADGKVKHVHKSPSPLEIPATNLILDALAVQ